MHGDRRQHRGQMNLKCQWWRRSCDARRLKALGRGKDEALPRRRRIIDAVARTGCRARGICVTAPGRRARLIDRPEVLGGDRVAEESADAQAGNSELLTDDGRAGYRSGDG